MEIRESGENYLETIMMLSEKRGVVRAVDIAAELGFSKPTVSVALKNLKESGFVEQRDGDNQIILTEAGYEIAARIYERHRLVSDLLMSMGVSEESALKDACKIEHDISDETFLRLKEFRKGNFIMENLLSRRSIRKYKAEQIKDSELDAVLKAGMYAPTAGNRQSPLMVAVQDKEDIEIMRRQNALATPAKDESRDTFYGAPTVIVVFAEKGFDCGVQDASLVMGNLMNAARAVGLGSCWINRAKETFNTQEGIALMKKWGIDPEKWEGVGNCILGYPDEEPEVKPRKEGYVIRIK